MPASDPQAHKVRVPKVKAHKVRLVSATPAAPKAHKVRVPVATPKIQAHKVHQATPGPMVLRAKTGAKAQSSARAKTAAAPPQAKRPSIMALSMLVAGLAMLFLGVRNYLGAENPSTWPTTEGTIIMSEVTKTGNTFKPNINFRYRLEGNSYSSSRITFYKSAQKSKADAQLRVDQFPLGTTTPIFYNPNDHETAVLVATLPMSLYYLPAAGLVLFLGGAIGSLIGSKRE